MPSGVRAERLHLGVLGTQARDLDAAAAKDALVERIDLGQRDPRRDPDPRAIFTISPKKVSWVRLETSCPMPICSSTVSRRASHAE